MPTYCFMCWYSRDCSKRCGIPGNYTHHPIPLKFWSIYRVYEIKVHWYTSHTNKLVDHLRLSICLNLCYITWNFTMYLYYNWYIISLIVWWSIMGCSKRKKRWKGIKSIRHKKPASSNFKREPTHSKLCFKRLRHQRYGDSIRWSHFRIFSLFFIRISHP